MEGFISRSTKHDLRNREIDICDCLAQGVQITEMCSKLSKKYQVTELTIRRQYLEVMKGLTEQDETKKAELRSQLLLQSEHLQRKATETGNIRNALDAINTRAKIGGLFDSKAEKAPDRPKIVMIEEQSQSGLALVGKTDDTKS